ncbi:hypothetical protein [Sorangium sp. So ce385]|uniref:hypothetical protein n=1 Tax=Sorangium sp. So ce385 TaxID=3133308 RepID=UPI003F5AEC3E
MNAIVETTLRRSAAELGIEGVSAETAPMGELAGAVLALRQGEPTETSRARAVNAWLSLYVRHAPRSMEQRHADAERYLYPSEVRA